jgi:hypothetical protein
MKKGDLSINIIIVAAIALIILVIISVLIFGTGRDIIFAKSCKGLSADNQCIPSGGSCSDISDTENWVPHPTAQCQPKEDMCCIKQ